LCVQIVHQYEMLRGESENPKEKLYDQVSSQPQCWC